MRYSLKVWSNADHKWARRTVLTHEFAQGERIYHLLKIKALADAIGRTAGCIVGWERDEKIPKPRFVVRRENPRPGAQHRWYSLRQIEIVQTHFITMLGNRTPETAKNATFDFDEFFKRVRRDWALDDSPLISQTTKPQKQKAVTPP